MYKNVFALVLFIALFLASASLFGPVEAATLRFEPSSVDTSSGETFDLDIYVDTDDSEVFGVDAVITYDSNIMQVEKITNGTFLDIGHKDYDEKGNIVVIGYVQNSGESVIGEDVLATITFKATKGGTGDVDFVCNVDDKTESNIITNDLDSSDIIDCAASGKSVVVVDGGTSTSKSSSSSSSSSTTSGQLPATGVFEDMLMAIIVGATLFGLGIIARFFV